ncbi:MAG: hypothetical protein ACD_80C00073G0001, partial [uncultured bacterium (gcode 4)]
MQEGNYWVLGYFFRYFSYSFFLKTLRWTYFWRSKVC